MRVRLLLSCLWLLLGSASVLAQTPIMSAFQPLDRLNATALAQAANHATPTIVALWSAECTHCKKNLALFAAMAHREPRLQLITIATETFDVAQAEPLDRLALPGRRFAFGSEQPEALAFALDPKWRGELPRTLLFDGHGGKLAVSGLLTESAVRRALGLE